MSYESPTYPGQKNNDPNASQGLPIRDLSIINQPAGFIEFNNTEGHETVSLVHKTGSMFQFNNFYTGLFSPRGYKSHIIGDNFQQINGKTTIQSDKSFDMIQMGDSFEKSGNIADWQEHSEKYLETVNPVHQNKRLFELRRVAYKNPVDQSKDQKKEGKLAPCPGEEYSTTVLYTAAATIYVPAVKLECDRTIMTFEPPEIKYGKKTGGGGRMFDGWYCLTCWGTKESPSSQDGEWEKEKIKDEIEKQYADLTESLIDIESKFGQSSQPDGGHKITKTGQSQVEVVGTTFNSLESFRIDPVGKLVPYGVKVDPFGGGVYMQYRESPLVEAVHVDPGIGGDKVQTFSDRWAVNVGSNGIHFKTSGQFNIFGTIMNIMGETITIHSRNEIALGATRLDLSGEIITLRPKATVRQIEDSTGKYRNLPANGKDETEAERHVLVDGNLNISQNMIVKGGTHIEGELSVHHITAPMEYQITETDFEVPTGEVPCESGAKDVTKADILPNIVIGTVTVDGQDYDVTSVCAPDAVLVHPHYHYFKNIPLKLFRDNATFEVTIGNVTESKDLNAHDAVRGVGARNNFDNIVLAKPVEHSETNDTVLEKFGGICGNPLIINNSDWEGTLDSPVYPKGEGEGSETFRKPINKSKKTKTDETLIGLYDANKKELEKSYQNTQDFRNTPIGLS